MTRSLWGWAAAGAVALQAAHGCASAPPAAVPATVVVLLPDDAGHAGRLTLSGAGGGLELSVAGEAVRVPPAPGQAAAPFAMPPDEITRLFGAAIAAQPGPPAHFLLYFEGDSDTLTAESVRRLDEVVKSVLDRRAVDVSIVGHTDTVGTRDYNFRLGLRRALRVREAIRALPIDEAIVRVDTHGKDAPLVPTGDNVPEPRNRRVEVTVR